MSPARHLPSTPELLLRRVRYVALAMVVSLSFSGLASTFAGATATGVATGLVVILAASVFGLHATGRIPDRHAGAAIWVLWLAIVATTLFAQTELPSWAVDQWMAILFVGYGAIQLERRYIVLAYGPGVVFWAALIFVVAGDGLIFRLVTVAGSLGLAGLAYVAQVAFLAEIHRAERETAEMRDRMEEAQRLQAVGTLAGGVAHELNNVLAGILGIAGLLQQDLEGSAKEDADAIAAACERGAELTSALLVFGRRKKTGEQVPARLAEIVDEVEPILRRGRPTGTTLRIDPGPPGLAARVSRSDTAQAIVNLALNAFHACPDGTVEIVLAGPEEPPAHPLAVDGPHVRITVRDEGAGMDDETRTRMFEPFFTTKEPGQGTGLGLAQVYGTVTSARGFVEAASTPGEGTTVDVWLPACEAPSVSAEPPERASEREGKVALVVDDEPMVRRSSQLVLARAGYEVHLAADADEAEAVAAARDGRFDVVLLDLRMPGRDGDALAKDLRAKWPDLSIAIYSGNVDADARARCREAGVAKILAKPLRPAELIAALEDLSPS